MRWLVLVQIASPLTEIWEAESYVVSAQTECGAVARLRQIVNEDNILAVIPIGEYTWRKGRI